MWERCRGLLYSLASTHAQPPQLSAPPTRGTFFTINELALKHHYHAKDTSDKGLILKMFKEFILLNTKNTNNPILKWAKDLYKHFFKDVTQMVNRHMKRCSASLIIRETQTKTTMRQHFIPVRMAIMNKSTKSRCWWGCGERGTLVHCWWECRLVQPPWKGVWSYLKKFKNALWSSDSTSGNIQRTPQTYQKNICILYVYCSVIYNCYDMEATQVPINRWVDKKAVKYLCNRISAIKKEWNITLCNSIDGPRAYYVKWNKSVRVRQITYDFTYMWNLKSNINEQTK